ncbi:secreted protein with Ig-like and vWFA domain [Micromonospora pisi]|uniref:Secreted protein with Ig-like and vWFA domain n=1 Tax=Micromonospora pisi TaxID=589240 RepID=A0A495JAD2_9ACTN|nr:VWA domain-containing protein [Micromonospora pisi]RKR85986.1 secreted protein with Ig-like and vWFA domain [Micromonospora pisi]
MSDVRAEVFQNEYLAEGATVADAVVTVTVGDGHGPAVRTEGAAAAEIIIIDCSGSMHGERMVQAKKAAAVAIDTLRDGVGFAVIAGSSGAVTAFPSGQRLAVTSPSTRAEAKAAIRKLKAGGGTAMSTWLRLARDLFREYPVEIRHAILLTDGCNGESERTLQAVLDDCAGEFVCDSRGVGEGWRAAELLKIADTLLGTADGMKDPAGLAADFQAMIEAAMGKTMADVFLRVWTPAGGRLRFLKQVHPEIVELTDRRSQVSARAGDYPTGSWGAESRDYHLSVELEPGTVGEEVLAARVSVVRRDETLAQALVRAVWTDDTAHSTKINQRVAHYSGEIELAEAIQEGLAAREVGDVATATARLGRAVRLATESGRSDTVRLLAGVVEVTDAREGTVVLKQRSANRDVDVDAEIAAVTSRKTTRVRPA